VSNNIDSSSLIPLYAQLEKILYGRISSGHYESGSLIPSETQLGEEFEVSRITVRKAIEGLVSEGLLTKRRGKGTVVNAPKFIDDTFNLQSFSEKTDKSLHQFSTEVLDIQKVVATSLIAFHMGIDEGTPILYIKRLRYSDGKPIGVFDNYILGNIGLGIEEDYSKSLYKLIEEKCGILIKEAKREVSSILADNETVQLLNLEKSDPILSLRTYSYNSNMQVVEYSEGCYRADSYKFVVHLNRNRGTNL
jgi:GntR family transcriptional regulator